MSDSPKDTRTLTTDPHATLTRPSNGADAAATRPGTRTAAFGGVPSGLPAVPGYAVSGELARGGMGAVYSAHDPVLGRDIAVKVMHPGQDPDRFVVESQVTARLPHPGVPPVYALGALADGRPFLAMKLVEGRTLADQLRDREPADLPRLLGAFERICETVGYAHSRGIVHRDLKPSNVMVGAFGEVQVMDWGLARTVGSADRGTRGESDGGEDTATATHSFPHFEATQPGGVKGTPAFMAPEQARGEPVDARADVFALGGIVAAVLTGRPPFAGNNVMDTVLKAAEADLGACFDRLAACGADPELVAVAKTCLAPRPAERYADGAAVAEAVAAYRRGVEDRLRRAERDRAAADVRAVESRRRKRLQMLGLVLVAVAMTAAVGIQQRYERREEQREAGQRLADARTEADRRATESRLEGERDAEARNKAAQARTGVAAGLDLATRLREQHRFKDAGAALAQALDLANGGAPERVADVERARGDLAFVAELDDIRYRKWWAPGGTGRRGYYNTAITGPEYSRAFAARGLNLTQLDPTDAAGRLAASPVKAALVAAIDDWAVYGAEPPLRDRLLTITRTADPVAWTDRLRTTATWPDRAAVQRLAADADPATVSPAAFGVLAELMRAHRLDLAPLLTAARAEHPTSFELAFALGQWHTFGLKDDRHSGSYEAAVALRPDHPTSWHNLGGARYRQGDARGALVAYRRAAELQPNYSYAHYNVGLALAATGDTDGALAAFRRCLDLDPNYAPAHNNVGNALGEKGDTKGAVAAYHKAVACDPKYFQAYYNLGGTLKDAGDLDGAVAAYLDCVRANPRYADAHNSLGMARQIKGDPDGAAAAFREAIKHDPAHAPAHTNLGALYADQRQYATAAACARRAIQADPRYSNAHALLGLNLQQLGDVPGARAAFAEAARLNPKRYGALLARLPVPVAPPPREVRP